MQQTAHAGLTGSGTALPYLERVQKAFGHHDLSHVRAHTNQAAREASEKIGAKAFASGTRVAFRSAPNLHTVAHEAAHIVQQQAGLQLKDGVGKAGDVHERHADEVADRVVQGRSAVELLDGVIGAPARKSKVQKKALQRWSETVGDIVWGTSGVLAIDKVNSMVVHQLSGAKAELTGAIEASA